MQYLITGAAGFLGSALSNQLVQDGHAVRGLDDLSTGDPTALLPEVRFTRGDINDRPKLWTLLQDVDCVYHLAARVLVQESVLYPREYNQVNVGGTVTLMEAMRDVGVRRVVFISSGAIYGNQSVQPVREKFAPRPHSPYAVSKLAAEYYVRTIGELWGMETVCLRVFNAYGPGQQMPPVYTPVIPNFLRQALMNGTLVIHGDGKQTRDYAYIDDVVRAMVAASTAPDIHHDIINVGSGVETSVLDLANLVCEVTGKQPEIVINPRNAGGPGRLCADLSLAREKLGFEPRLSLTAGLQLTLEKDARLSQSG
ncbi:epimerase [Ornatilinea apprima]|uniref:Epimerase n=1 Tax=Ornatilinea apprima TaxID=1134406 RepID=A0A0N8GN38_9CHLR|nr:NAD-dependent epimerase/dehydratase family protein [Ornatilinea apprima]KPL77018.1 epimerase [Ornatilinea apprima]